ncbi:glycosyltransferase family 4 protein [Methanosphaerula palustris]|nr:glycosyltransferase family 4 protein [Methanosphaerula palustris]
MKILILTHNIAGGMIHYTSQLANTLAEEHEVVVIAPRGVKRETFQPNVRLLELDLGNIVKNFIKNTLIFTRVIRFLRTVREEDPDIIHVNGYSLWFSLLLPFLHRYPIITTIHDVNPHTGSRQFDQTIARRLFFWYSDALIVHGEWAKKQLSVSTPIYVIPHGDYSFFSTCEGEEVAEEVGTILFFGRIEDYKGLQYLLAAMPEVVSGYPDARLVIAGNGDMGRYMLLLPDESHCTLINRFIEDCEIPSLFMKASMVVLPYIEGTQTGVVPIAYAFHKPVIVTDIGSIPEVVEQGKTGLIVPSHDSAALADGILKLLRNEPLRRAMGDAALRKMKRDLSWETVRGKTVIAYKSVIEDRQCR